MGQGARVTFDNLSSYDVTISTADQDWVTETSNLNETIKAKTQLTDAYFEYSFGHTGHITILMETSNGTCQLGLVEFDEMPSRTVKANGLIRFSYTSSEISGARTFAISIYNN